MQVLETELGARAFYKAGLASPCSVHFRLNVFALPVFARGQQIRNIEDLFLAPSKTSHKSEICLLDLQESI
jgi:hypothetical protein